MRLVFRPPRTLPSVTHELLPEGLTLMVGVPNEVDTLAWMQGARRCLVDGSVLRGGFCRQLCDVIHGVCKVSSRFHRISAGVHWKTPGRHFHVKIKLVDTQ